MLYLKTAAVSPVNAFTESLARLMLNNSYATCRQFAFPT